MILRQDFGYTLRCSGCRAYLTLTLCELQDMDRALDIQAAMRAAHAECDSYKDVGRARAAIQAKRKLARMAAKNSANREAP